MGRNGHGHGKQKGFSLIELMVGLALGLIVVLAVTQTASLFEGQKSTTTTGAEAQENGLMALQLIQEDVRKAAAGFTHVDAFRCDLGYRSYFQVSASAAGGPIGGFSTATVVITDGGDSRTPDQISVFAGARFTGSAPTYLTKKMATPDAPVHLESTYGFEINTSATPNVYPLAVIADGAGNCTLIKVTALGADDDGVLLRHDNGEGSDAPEYNPTSEYMTDNEWPTYPTRAKVFNVGTTVAGGVNSRTYQVAGNKLQSVSSLSGAVATTEDLVDGIVQLQAQYGIAASETDKAISSWVDATDGWATGHDDLTEAQKRQIRAIRIVVIARAGKRDPALATESCKNGDPEADGGKRYDAPCIDTLASPWMNVDLSASAGDTEWQHYRYRVYQTVVPVRNVIWTH